MQRSEEFYVDTDKLGIQFASSVKGEVSAARYGSGKDTPLTATGKLTCVSCESTVI
jgi:hypothetical protein